VGVVSSGPKTQLGAFSADIAMTQRIFDESVWT